MIVPASIRANGNFSDASLERLHPWVAEPFSKGAQDQVKKMYKNFVA